MSRFCGSSVAIVTPMYANGRIDYVSFGQLIEWHISCGTQNIVAVGTTGESATLEEQEHLDVIRFVIEQADGRIGVIAGAGANSTYEAERRTEAVTKLGADASLQVVPYYNKPTQEGLFYHFKNISQVSDLPIFLYNVPSRTITNLEIDTIKKLSVIDNIIGIKEASGNIDFAKKIRQSCGEDFLLLSGDDITAAQFMAEVGDGTISVTANIVPQIIRDICNLSLSSNQEKNDKALMLDKTICSLHKHLFCESNPIAVKWTLWKMGKMDNGIRLPLTPLSSKYHQLIFETLTQLGIYYED